MKKIKKQIAFITFCLGVAVFSSSYAQSKYLDKNGVLIFEASEKLFEEVKAVNKSVTAIYNDETNEIASLALMKGFHFKNSLMEEHFNENYIESNTYPKATFKGTLVNFNAAENFDADIIEVVVKGVLEVHGKQKEIETTLTMQKVDDTISMTGEFKVTPSDFEIEIPKIVRNKIAKEILVRLDFKLVKK